MNTEFEGLLSVTVIIPIRLKSIRFGQLRIKPLPALPIFLKFLHPPIDLCYISLTNDDGGKTKIMFKRAIATILILFLAGGAIFYLHQQKEFIGYFPRLDHIVRHPDQHLSEWRHGASNIMADLHKMFSETLPNIDGMSTLKKYLPFPELKPEKSPDKTPNQVKVSPISRDGWTSLISIFKKISIFKNPGRSSGTPAPVVYTWVDKRGIRHFSEVKPLDSPYEIEIAQP